MTAERRIVARYVRDRTNWHGQVKTLRKKVEDLREMRQDYRKQLGDIRRTVRTLRDSLSGSPLYEDLQIGLSRAVQSLDGHDPRTTSFLNQLDYLTRQYDEVSQGLN